jgi:RES domain-containing protein
MAMRENPLHREFVAHAKRAVGDCGAWRGVTFRSVELEFAKKNSILAGEGSFKAGGRWNAPGMLAAIYSSVRPGTAADEAFGIAARYQLATTEIVPRVVVGIEWRLKRVLDLTRADTPAWVNLTEWLAEDFRAINRQGWETLAQAVGRAAFSARIEALLAPSAVVAGGINLVVFKKTPAAAVSGRVLGAAELERYLK